MATVTSIAPADLRTIENNLRSIFQHIDAMDGHISTVDANIRTVYDDLIKLSNEFHAYVDTAERQHNVSLAETRLVKIRQELEAKYGHYAQVRRTTTGILQADDLGIVRSETIQTATEDLMLATPNYWLAPALVALSAWISNQPDLANKALKESIRRNDEKTSLLFALICRRADRKPSSLRWVQRYLANQDEEHLGRQSIVILNAYAGGLLGADSEGLVSRQLQVWLNRLSEQPGFTEKQSRQWVDALLLKRQPLADTDYTYLRKYSATWSALQDTLCGANLHTLVLSYFEQILGQESSSEAIKVQLDNILMSLVSNFDEEELPLHRDEKLNQLIISSDGDLQAAKAAMAVEQTALEPTADFTQLLTNSAMNPEATHAAISMQKYAIALSRDWILNAYNDLTAQNRMKIPHEVGIDIDTFHEKTIDGTNEQELVEHLDALIETERQSALAQVRLTGLQKFCFGGGIAIAILGALFCIAVPPLGIIVLVIGAMMLINHFRKKSKLEPRRKSLNQQFDEKKRSSEQILRAVLAEVVDYRSEFNKKDGESQKVTDFLAQLSPEQYLNKIAGSSRRIKIVQ